MVVKSHKPKINPEKQKVLQKAFLTSKSLKIKIEVKEIVICIATSKPSDDRLTPSFGLIVRRAVAGINYSTRNMLLTIPFC